MPLDFSALLALRPRQVVLRANADMKTTNPTTPALASDQKALLLRSVASFLDANGFSKTLKRFLSEADIPIEDLKSSADLEEIYSKYLEICDDANTKLKDKDKIAVTEEVKKPVQQLEEPDKNEDKNKKKKKKLSPESDPVPDATEKKSEDLNVEEKTSAAVEPHKKKTKDKEKKKQAPVSVTHNVDSEANETQAEEKSSKSKTKKKKKDESKDTNVDSKISDAVAATEEDSKGSKKRKRAVPDENRSKPSDKIETEESKRRKVNSASEQHEQGLENGIENNSNQQLNGLENGKIDKSAEKSAVQKSGTKETNGSAEPSTVKAFQRVKVDEVVFTDDRLKDNSYWAKGGADSGYGAKAEEVLGQVRGRGFRHEKTKKKRGIYRGGQIDLQSHSIKFNYSDEE